MNEQEQVLLPKEAKDILRVGLSTIYEMFHRGQLRGFRVGKGLGGIRILRSSVDALMSQPALAPNPPLQQEKATPPLVTPPPAPVRRPTKSRHELLVCPPPRTC